MNVPTRADDDPVGAGIRGSPGCDRKGATRRAADIHLVLLPLERRRCRADDFHDERRTFTSPDRLRQRLRNNDYRRNEDRRRINLQDGRTAGYRNRATRHDDRVVRFIGVLRCCDCISRGGGSHHVYIVFPPLIRWRCRARRLDREKHRSGQIDKLGLRLRLNGDGPGRADDTLAHGVVAAVGDKNIPGAIDRHTVGRRKTDGVARAVHGARRARESRDRAHDTGRRNPTDRAVNGVGYKNRARAVDRYSGRTVEARLEPNPVGTSFVTRRASQGRDGPSGGDFADRVVVGVGDVDIARTIDRHPTRAVEARVSTVAIEVTRIGAVAARERAHAAARRNLAEGVVARIRDVDVARTVHGNPVRRRKLGVASHPIHTARGSGTTC